MIELARVIEDQTKLYSYNATKNEKLALELESLLEITKPKNLFQDWHRLIATPFRYSPPHRDARFRPPFGKNVFYGSTTEETTLYEHAYHYMKERVHLKMTPEPGSRTIFIVEADDSNSINIINEPTYKKIMDKNDYSASHQYIDSNPQATFIIYPSCRDPQHRENAAILDINHLEKTLKWEAPIKFFYDNTKKIIHWIDYQLDINWNQVT